MVKPEVKKGFVATATGPQRMTWSRLLARVFAIDITRCGGCGAKIYPEQCEIVTAAPLVAAILHWQLDPLEALPLGVLMRWHREAIEMAKLLHGNGSKED